jgi:hypothetical protein
MRARNIKPGFFKNEFLAELPTDARLLFIGLWCMADREGRMEDRPKKIRAEIFPFDYTLDVESMMKALHAAGFLIRYEVDGCKYVQISNFVKHQDPHYREKASEIPPPNGLQNQMAATSITRTQRARILERDGGKCRTCGSTENLCIDHVIPVSRGGDSLDGNLQALCASCNTKKSNRLDSESSASKPSKTRSPSDFDPNSGQRRVNACDASPSDSLIPDSLIPDPPASPKARKRAGRFDPLAESITAQMQEIDGLANAWIDWVTYRKECRKPLTEKSVEEQIAFLATQPDPVGCIRQSIRNQWQGIFEVKNNGRPNSNVGPRNGSSTNTGKRHLPHHEIERFNDIADPGERLRQFARVYEPNDYDLADIGL